MFYHLLESFLRLLDLFIEGFYWKQTSFKLKTMILVTYRYVYLFRIFAIFTQIILLKSLKLVRFWWNRAYEIARRGLLKLDYKNVALFKHTMQSFDPLTLCRIIVLKLSCCMNNCWLAFERSIIFLIFNCLLFIFVFITSFSWWWCKCNWCNILKIYEKSSNFTLRFISLMQKWKISFNKTWKYHCLKYTRIRNLG